MQDEIDPIICLKDISYSYGREPVLDDIDLHIYKGEYVGILGPNGSGKTTLLRIMLGLLTPTKGTVKIFGVPQKQFCDWNKVGFVPQKATQIDVKFPITVKELVSLTAKTNTDVTASLAKVGMLDFGDSLITELSGGQQQRVFIAKALAGKPELLILDEPTVGIDAGSQTDFYKILTDLNKNEGMTIIMVSHDTDTVVRQVSRIVCINTKLVCYVTPHEFEKENYADKLYGGDRKQIIHHHTHA